MAMSLIEKRQQEGRRSSSPARRPFRQALGRVVWGCGLLACLCLLQAAAPTGSNPYDEDEDSPQDAKLPPGERAARKACTICHVFPEPSLLTKKNWAEQILPRMKVRLGVAIPDYASSTEGELIRARKIYTDKPLIPYSDWPLIEQWILTNAPVDPLPQQPHPEIEIGLKTFKTEPPRYRVATPRTTLVKISPSTHRIYVGDDGEQSLAILDQNGNLLSTIKLGNTPTGLVETPRGIYVTCIGSFVPSEVYRGEVLLFERKGDGFGEKQVILQGLPRPVQLEMADFNGDGKMDFALTMFGNLTGRFSWFENLGNDQYAEHILANSAGAIHCVAHDFNGDGKPDIAVLMAQELETLLILPNDGKGKFTGDVVFQKPPVYGHCYFELADFNKDGLMDIVVVNGDNGEYESPTKNYHGIRILMNKGANQYEEKYFFPLNGAYKAVVRDFDGDGDLDIAAISFFPDYVNSPRESFVYLENLGDMKFKPSTFKECIAGRWIVMDAGDLDGDGKVDLVLGSYAVGPTAVPKFLSDIWKKSGPSVQILRNQTK